MAMFGQLRNEFFKYRKRKSRSLDGSVSGVSYNRFRRSSRPVVGWQPSHGPIDQQELYNCRQSHSYHPWLNSPNIDWSEYEPYEGDEDYRVRQTSDSKMFRPFVELPEQVSNVPTYESVLPINQFLLKHMQEIYDLQRDVLADLADDESRELQIEDTLCDLLPIPADEVPVEELPDSLTLREVLHDLQSCLPEDHSDIVNLRTALRRVGEFEMHHVPEPVTSGPIEDLTAAYEHDPVQEAEQIFNQQMQEFDKAFELPEVMDMDDHSPDIHGYQQAEFDMMLEQTVPDASLMDQGSLEQIAEQAETEMMPDAIPGDMDMIHEEVDQAIDQLSEQLTPDYDPLMEETWEMQQYLFDPQYMPHYMMPGPIPFGLGI